MIFVFPDCQNIPASVGKNRESLCNGTRLEYLPRIPAARRMPSSGSTRLRAHACGIDTNARHLEHSERLSFLIGCVHRRSSLHSARKISGVMCPARSSQHAADTVLDDFQLLQRDRAIFPMHIPQRGVCGFDS